MRYWAGVAGGIGIGAIVGFIAGMAATEDKARKEYAESLESYKRAIDLARKLEDKKEDWDIDANQPMNQVYCYDSMGNKDPRLEPDFDVSEKEERIDAKLIGGPKLPEDVEMTDPSNFTGGAEVPVRNVFDDTKEINQIYDRAQGEDFTPERSNPYHEALHAEEKHFTYLEEEDYMDEEDGFEKSQITILMSEPPVFLENGGEIRDWEAKVGKGILGDFYTMVGPKDAPVLWVRNHQINTDYEVVRELP